MRKQVLFLALFVLGSAVAQPARMRVERSTVSFISEAPLEIIEAATVKAAGLLDAAARTFAVQIPIATLEGFNSPLQREHFNENYLVSRTWPNATFQGRIIETVDLTKLGSYDVRAKGMLSIRGEAKERIIPCRVVVHPLGVEVTSSFEVVLEDHGIRIPRVVQQKIAATVRLEVDLHFITGPAR
ncbi:MAG: YceI family protein [Flavobacteriales bacterium]|nr:YceI family protein [Flavobacteriales bacterium]